MSKKNLFLQTILDKVYSQKKKAKQCWTGVEDFDIYFLVILIAIAKNSFH